MSIYIIARGKRRLAIAYTRADARAIAYEIGTDPRGPQTPIEIYRAGTLDKEAPRYLVERVPQNIARIAHITHSASRE